jgi:hypothetical protein
MSRRQLYGDLNAVRALVADGLSHLDRTVGDLDQYWLNSARGRLRTVDDYLVAAAGGIGGLPRVVIGAVAMFLAGWATAAATTALGFSPAWVIVTTVPFAALTDLLVTMPARRLTFTLADAVNRRRLTRAARPARPLRAPPPRGPFASGLIESGPVASGLNTDELNTDELGVGGLGASGLGASGLAADGLAGALEPLLQARVRLVSAALRQVDSRRWRSPYLAHLAAEHRSIARIAEADRLLCQAVNYLEIYLDEHTKEPG